MTRQLTEALALTLLEIHNAQCFKFSWGVKALYAAVFTPSQTMPSAVKMTLKWVAWGVAADLIVQAIGFLTH